MRISSFNGGTLLLLLLLIVLITVNNNHLVFSATTSATNVTSVTNSLSTPRTRINLQRSFEQSRKFPCKESQPRAYNLRDLLHSLNLQNPGESANQPVYMIVKRCDGHSGCCMSPDMACSPINNSTYYEDIEIELWSLETNETKRQWISIEQHGKCSCEVTNLSDRERLELKKPHVILLR